MRNFIDNLFKNLKLIWNNEYAIVVQQYVCQDETYTLYKRNSLFGKYKICNVLIGGILSSTFDTPAELVNAIRTDIKKSNFCKELELKNNIYEEVEEIFNNSSVLVYVRDIHSKCIYKHFVRLTEFEKTEI